MDVKRHLIGKEKLRWGGGGWEDGKQENTCIQGTGNNKRVGKLHIEKLRSLYPSQNVAMARNSKKMRWAGYVVRM
jgi:hypothetical protein